MNNYDYETIYSVTMMPLYAYADRPDVDYDSLQS